MTEMIPVEQNNASSPNPEETSSFTVIGSGIIGLLTAHQLVDQGHKVTVVSREGQPNMGTNSTSAIAVGQFLPWLPEAHARTVMHGMSSGLSEIVDFGREFYTDLAKHPAETGVMPVRNVELVGEADPWPTNLPSAMNVESLELPEPIAITGPDGKPEQFTEEYIFDTFSINTRKTLAWLAQQAKEKGVKFEVAHIKPEDLARMEGVVINATGMGAQELTGAIDIRHYKGHTIIIQPREGQMVPTEAISASDLIIVPREDGTVIAGALYRENPKRPQPEADEAEELLARLAELATKTVGLVEGLNPELFTEGEIIVHQAGYRVVIGSGGIRVAPDEKLENILHAYGFSGIGWSVGPHFAKTIAQKAIAMHHKRRNNVTGGSHT